MPRIVPSDEARPLDLEQQKKRAKELCRDLARGEVEAVRRFRDAHPKSAGLTDEQLGQQLAKVTEAQLVIARELGLPSWSRLRRHITRLTAARAAVAVGASGLDGDVPTTHVRCGTDIRDALQRAGLNGEFVEFADPLCQGPIPRHGDLLETRARFIAEAYDVPLDDARVRLAREERDLRSTIERDRVALWFEHDSFDQLILARILAYYGEHGVPRRVELIHIDRFPAVARFRGLGELSAAALRVLWEDRVPVGAELIALGSRVWAALREPSPTALWQAAGASRALPRMGAAVMRHLQELPWRGDGLSLTQRLTLELLVGGPLTAGELFGRLVNDKEPLVHLGDAMYWVVLDDLCRGRPAPIAVDEGSVQWPSRAVTLTDAGRQMLAGELDRLRCAPPERWVGGVRVDPGSRNWRWDPAAAAPRQD